MKIRVLTFVCAVGAAGLASSCGGGSNGKPGGAKDGGDGPGVQCPPAGGANAEPQPETFVVDGGVPLDQYARAIAVARCTFLSRCFGLATYATNNCVDTMLRVGTWSYLVCGGDFADIHCSGSTGGYNTGPRVDVLNAAIAGAVHYDAQQAAQCVSALLAEGCGFEYLLENLPACTGVFTCLSGSDAGASDASATDAGAADGGICSEVDLLNAGALKTCSTDSECAGESLPAGPNCVDGLCSPTKCGFTRNCAGFVGAGEPCDVTAPSFIDPIAADLNRICAPGLVCQYATADAGAGTCIQPKDVGAACSLSSDCKPGLACTCGACAIPPTSGPCVDHRCKTDVAYCDTATNLCMPVVQMDGACSDAFVCAPGLTCVAFTCEPPMF